MATHISPNTRNTVSSAYAETAGEIFSRISDMAAQLCRIPLSDEAKRATTAREFRSRMSELDVSHIRLLAAQLLTESAHLAGLLTRP